MSQTVLAPGAAQTVAVRENAPDLRVVYGAAVLLVGGTAWLAQAADWRQAALYLVGGALGVTLYHAMFGFTTAWRVFLADRRGAGLRAQMLLLGATTLLLLPAIARGSMFGRNVAGSLAPVGVSVVVGAFIFGIGMQLGGGCASGTLYTAGGGNPRMLVTLASFIAGSVVGAAHFHWWTAKPALRPIALLTELGAVPALALQLAVLGGIAAVTVWLERRRHGALAAGPEPPRRGWARALRGPWPLVAGALVLAALSFVTLGLSGRPWGVTSAFALWGSKLLAAGGADVASWPYWTAPARAASLRASITADVTSMMDFGIMAGALLAAGLAGKFAPRWRTPARSLAAAALGGLLLGYGARLAYGCNIGAFLSGIASSSLHGWVWFPAAFAGNALGARLRPFFGLSPR
jgi:uncharacterized membrane protein YedE/YeeE